MIGRFRNKLWLLLAVVALTGSTGRLQAENREEERLLNRAEKIVKSVRNIQADESSKIPSAVMEQAKGVIILKQYEAGVIFGAKGGFGLVLKRNSDGSWGAPAWIRTAEISGGLQLGAHKLNVMLVIMNDKSLKVLEKAKFRLGIDATVTRGPTGSNYEARTGLGADILAYTDFQGYYAGAAFDGSFLLPDRRSNELTYGDRLEVAEIITSETLETPDFLEPVITALAEIESGEPET